MASEFLRKLKNWLPPSRSFLYHERLQTEGLIRDRLLEEEQRRAQQDAMEAEQCRVRQETLEAEQRRAQQDALEAEQRRTQQDALKAEQCRVRQEALEAELARLGVALGALPGQIALEAKATRDMLPVHAFPVSDATFERNYYKDFPTFQTPDAPHFVEEFRTLIRNLDEDSTRAVVLALKRLRIIQTTSEVMSNLYGESEQAEGNRVIETLLNQVIQIAEDCFFWNHYYLPIYQFESCVFLDRCGVPLLHDPSYFANKDIIDAGAFIGDSALIFSPLTSKSVHAFEPVPSNYALLQKTISLNGCTNVVPRNLALGAENGTISMSVCGSASTHYENGAIQYGNQVEASVTTIDAYVAEHNLVVGLIKADLEGAEQEMLKGAMNTIKTQLPTLLISIYHNASDFFHIKPMLEELDLGYRFRIFHPTFGSVMTETMLIAEIERT